MDSLLALINNFIAIINEASPWLLLGLIIAGLMKSMVPTQVLSQHLGEGKIAIVKAAFIGAPLPLCSCGVIPVATQLHRSGASSPATSAFLVATPETGVDSVSVSYALLGPVMAVYRPISAITSAIFTGLLVDRGTKSDNARINETPTVTSTEVNTGFNKTPTLTSSEKAEHQHGQTSCCASHSEADPIHQTVKEIETEQALEVKESSCCASTATAVADDRPSLLSKFSTGLRYAFTKLLDDLILWLLIGLVFATLIRTFLPADFLLQYGSGISAMLLMILISVPMYICATASTPLAAGLIMAGISPGTALVFMMAGPATNISTLGVIRNEMGGRVLTLYLAGIVVSSIAFGLGLDYALGYFDISIHEQMSHSHELLPIWFAGTCSVLLLLCAIKPLRKRILNA
ncbi:SO_0444 family Cu/Zn efflux transporter [Thalassotalea sp. PS06]|uniref:SO_0444 family Cu/Zn efflux transporter n=1 Tax=Thalassotalea sp. PS06 TaxID=2594005 RepID=UPI0011659936|nr:SO_0444 family Cu/Zn efflux transporter [Thalassotalea sp. PS06]QDP00524.1 permease [Thalassotalea sp. PS06]